MRSRKLPSFSQWKQIFKVLKRGEKITLLTFTALAVGSLILAVGAIYINNTNVVPTFGGSYTEGVVGQPRFLNPIYGETNDTDRSIIDLVYSGIMTYDKNGDIVKDLVDDYQISADGKTYTFQLKDNVYWHDGAKLTVDDIIYTIKTIQNSDFKSPLRANWLDVEALKVSDKTFTLSLRTPYNSFLENCTLKIIPQHIWENILAENFTLSSYNLKPIGSGPYFFAGIENENTGFIQSLDLESNRRYYGKVSYISHITFNFFKDKSSLISAANQRQIDGFSLSSLDNNQTEAEKEIRQGISKNEKFSFYTMSMPRYFAMFFNTQKSKIFSDSNITKALSYSVNKEEFVQKIKNDNKSNSYVVNSPILPDFFGYDQPTVNYSFDIEQAKQLLDKSGYKDNGSGQRSKANTKKPAFQFTSYLKIGSKGNEVTELQSCLSKLDPTFKDLLKNETNGTFGKGLDLALTEFQKKYMPDVKPTGETGAATRKKLNELCLAPQDNSQVLSFTITTVNQPEMIKNAGYIKDYWQKVGVVVDVKSVDLSELKQIIKDRSYDVLFYGEALGTMPDLYPFWHSSQVNDPGLNLTDFQNKDADLLLKDARETLDLGTKQAKYEKLQDVILKSSPALFLYNTDFVYWVTQKVKGVDTDKIVDPAKRFSNINDWYLQTKRTWK